MFGESDSETERAGSPWDQLVSSSPATPITSSSVSGGSETDLKRIFSVELPKLIPEEDAGNVEYKLQLIDPTPERFLRLVTQLKWRLLEGGGQAYYELGVADSGQLVGLTRANMDRTLETLEIMAGEIGASVIIVKEIEVSPSMFEPARKAGKVNGAAFSKEKGITPSSSMHAHANSQPLRSRPTQWGAVEVLRKANGSSIDDSQTENESDGQHSNSDGLEGKSSTLIDDCCASKNTASNEIDPTLHPDEGVFQFDLEISSVFKPVAPKPRTFSPSMLIHETRFTSPNGRKGNKKPQVKTKGKPAAVPVTHSKKKPDSSAKRFRRDEGRRKNPETAEDGGDGPLPLHPKEEQLSVHRHKAKKCAIVNSELQELHVPLATVESELNKTVLATTTTVIVEEPLTHAVNGDPTLAEPRLIVEALVVRKLSVEEAFLDFGGFSLAD